MKLVIGGTAPQTLAGDNIHTADTTINLGADLIISSVGELQFYPTTNAVTNSVGGTGALSNMTATFGLMCSAPKPTPGNSWTSVNLGSLARTPFGPTFAVTSWAGFFAETTANSGIWKMVDGGIVWTFTESTGKLPVATYVPQPFDTWIGTYFPGEMPPRWAGRRSRFSLRRQAQCALGSQCGVGAVERLALQFTEPLGLDARHLAERFPFLAEQDLGGGPGLRVSGCCGKDDRAIALSSPSATGPPPSPKRSI